MLYSTIKAQPQNPVSPQHYMMWKKPFAGVRGQLIVLGGYQTQQSFTPFFLCRPLHTDTEFPHNISTQNRSNNLSILPDLHSNRISIHSPIISCDILGRFSVLQQILSLTVYHLKIYYFFLRYCAVLVFQSICNTDSQARLKDARILFKDWVPHGKITL